MRKFFLSINIFLFLIVGLAFTLRFYRVTTNPPSLNWDEVSIGYNAYSILKTGKDEWRKFLPLHFKSYGEYKLPVQVYLSIPGIALFGLNEFGVRITPVIYGTLTVLLLYFVTIEFTKDKKMSLVASLLLAISPWHIHLTRASFESSFSVFWVLLGILFLLKGLNKKPIYWVISVIPFALAVYTYNSARVFVPLLLFFTFVIFRKNFLVYKKYIFISTALFVLLLLPLVPFSLSGEVANRYKLVSVLTDPGLIPRIEEARNLSKLPSIVNRLVNNRVTYTTFYVASNYIAHFSPDFLFISGAGHKQHHPQGVGQLYLIQAPFIFLGLYFMWVKKFKYGKLIVGWIFLAFVPVAVTRDSIPHALRTVIANPAFQILTAYGFVWGLSWFRQKKLRHLIFAVSVFALGAGFLSYQNNFYNDYPNLYSRDWQYGYKEAVEYIGDHYSDYDKIVFTRHYGEPHEFTLFFLKWDPAKFTNDPNLNRFETFDWVRVLNFDKFYFPDLGDTGSMYTDIVKDSQFKNKKLLFIGKPGDFPDNTTKLKEVNFLDGNAAFEIVEYK